MYIYICLVDVEREQNHFLQSSGDFNHSITMSKHVKCSLYTYIYIYVYIYIYMRTNVSKTPLAGCMPTTPGSGRPSSTSQQKSLVAKKMAAARVPLFHCPKIDLNPGMVDFPQRDTLGLSLSWGSEKVEPWLHEPGGPCGHQDLGMFLSTNHFQKTVGSG